MIKDYLMAITGSDALAMVLLVLFFAVFLYIMYRTIKMDKNKIDKISRLPLEDDQEHLNVGGK